MSEAQAIGRGSVGSSSTSRLVVTPLRPVPVPVPVPVRFQKGVAAAQPTHAAPYRLRLASRCARSIRMRHRHGDGPPPKSRRRPANPMVAMTTVAGIRFEGQGGQTSARLDEEIAALQAERGGLTAEIARLSRVRGVPSLDEHNRGVSIPAELVVALARVHSIDERLELADASRSDASWVADVLGHFDRVWDALTVENRSRLRISRRGRSPRFIRRLRRLAA